MLTDVTAVLSAEFKYRINLYKSLILSAFQLHKKGCCSPFREGSQQPLKYLIYFLIMHSSGLREQQADHRELWAYDRRILHNVL